MTGSAFHGDGRCILRAVALFIEREEFEEGEGVGIATGWRAGGFQKTAIPLQRGAFFGSLFGPPFETLYGPGLGSQMDLQMDRFGTPN